MAYEIQSEDLASPKIRDAKLKDWSVWGMLNVVNEGLGLYARDTPIDKKAIMERIEHAVEYALRGY